MSSAEVSQVRGCFDDGTVLDSETFAVTEEERHELAKRLIADLRRRLLDLSTRNRLLSFSFGARARQVRVVDVLPDALYQRLVDGKTFVFRALPETDLVPEESNPRNLNSLLKRPLLSESTMLINFTFSMIPMRRVS